MTADADWPPEIDIAEMASGGDELSATYHDPSGTTSGTGTVSGDYTDWHVYGVKWDSSGVAFFWDGIEQDNITSGVTFTSLPFHLIFNLAVSSSWDSSATGYPATMEIDYVRAWVPTGVPDQPTVTSLSPADGVPTSGSVQVVFNTVSGATSYRVTPCPVDNFADTGNWNVSARHAATGSSSPITVTGLTNGVRYTFTVAAENGSGYSIESLPVPSLGPPATGSGTGILLAQLP